MKREARRVLDANFKPHGLRKTWRQDDFATPLHQAFAPIALLARIGYWHASSIARSIV